MTIRLPPDGPERRGPSRVGPYSHLGGLPPPLPAEPRLEGYRPSADATPVRPYLLTGGRVPTSASLEIEAQVVTTELGFTGWGSQPFEARDIVELCRSPLSVAEIATRLGLHLGVVRVLVDDLVGAGHLDVLRPEAGLATDIETLERVIRGLRAVS